MAWGSWRTGWRPSAGGRAVRGHRQPWELISPGFVEYEHRTLARPEPTAAHAARLTGLAERVTPMAERLGHLGAEFLVGASRIRIEGVYRADLAFIEEMGQHVVEICERGGLP
jgi:hypothetical protein